MGRYIHHEPNVSSDGKASNSEGIGKYQNASVIPLCRIQSPVTLHCKIEDGIQNFHEDYRTYFGNVPVEIWEKKIGKTGEEPLFESAEKKNKRAIWALGVGIIITFDAVIVLALANDFDQYNARVLDYFLPTAIGIVFGAVLLFLISKNNAEIREIIIMGCLAVLLTMIVLGLVFLALCKMSVEEKISLGGYFIILGIIIILLFTTFLYNKAKAGSIMKKGSAEQVNGSRGCGGGGAFGCGSGAGGGCGGGGCGGSC